MDLNTGRQDIAQVPGIPVNPKQQEQEEDIVYGSWAKGIIKSSSAENITKDASKDMVDVETDTTDALVRAPGVALSADITPHDPTWMFEQADVDYATELIIIDPPYIGHRSTGAFVWNNVGIGATTEFGWAAICYLGTLLFSDGESKSYTRAPDSTTVTDVSANVVAQCFATAFGRVFAGAFVDPITGLQALAVEWNATSGSLTDFSGLGSGAEFLISNNQLADRVVAMVPIGLDTLAILNRKSLWVGYRTNIDERPADFQSRFLGLGCVARDSAAATPWGVIYLSDDGVCFFDLNSSIVISHAINDILLPIDYSRISEYRGTFDQATLRYILTTPFGTYVYQFPHGISTPFTVENIPSRWFFRTFTAKSVILFTDQSMGVFWDTVIGTWDQQTLTWIEMTIGESNASPQVFFGAGTQVGYESYVATDNLGTAQTPVWVSREDLMAVTDLIETHWLEVQYRANVDSLVTFTATDEDGNFTNSLTKTLPNTSGVSKRVLIGVSTMVGMGTEFQVEMGTGSIPAIERIRRVVMKAGPSISQTI